MWDTSVAVVVDRHFGGRLSDLAARLPVWVGTSEVNRAAVEAIWAEHRDYDVTRINAGAGYSGENLLLSQLDVVDLHHPSWRAMEVYGTRLTPLLTVAFEEYGVTGFQETPDGFVALRPGPIDA